MDQQFRKYNQKESVRPRTLQPQQSDDEQNSVSQEITVNLSEQGESGREGKVDYTNQTMKGFRYGLGFLALVGVIAAFIISPTRSYDIKDVSSSTILKDATAGTLFAKVDTNIEPRDYTIINPGGEPLELQIWDYAAEDGDYVQVIVDGTPTTPEFMIVNKVKTVKVPGTGIIQVKGTRDGGGGITYAVIFTKTGETYMNSAPVNGMNTYTIQSSI